MSQETREPESERNRRARRTKRVIVHATPGTANPIQPRRITLTDAVYKVVWKCNDLPEGATLLIHFREDPRGPFFRLEFAGNRVVGYGNRGPADTAPQYEYEVRTATNGVAVPLGGATLKNSATGPIPVDPNPGPIWNSEINTPEQKPDDPDDGEGEGEGEGEEQGTADV
jgi:hypothetical protein